MPAQTSRFSLILAEYVFSVCSFNLMPGKNVNKEIARN
jgi:hypothetical protein